MLHSGEEALRALGVTQCEFATFPRLEMAPGQWVGAVWSPERGERVWSGFRWGLTAPVASDGERRSLPAARAETLAQKSLFRPLLSSRRAVVPLDGFWLWREVGGQIRPFLVRRADGQPLFAAALWDENEDERELALVTVEANRLIEPLSSRMPAFLRPADVALWLDGDVKSPKPLLRALQTLPARGLVVTPTDAEARGRAALSEADDAREVLTLVYGPEFDAKKPRFAPRRRCVLRDHETGGHVFFRTRSFTRDDATRWHPVIDLEEGHVFCDCPDFQYRHEKHSPDVWTPQWWCKHVARAVENCRRHGELPLRSVNSSFAEAL
jgi:putative SOS response-associated peptidase YedK